MRRHDDDATVRRPYVHLLRPTMQEAAREFAEHGLSPGCVTVEQRNIEEQGFPSDRLAAAADAVFLDLPGPHKVVPSAKDCLKPDGRFCSFSPCIEQVRQPPPTTASLSREP